MNNEPVAWMSVEDGDVMTDLFKKECDTWDASSFSIPLYTHPHPDNLGLALSIVDQQKLEIEALKEKIKWLEGKELFKNE